MKKEEETETKKFGLTRVQSLTSGEKEREKKRKIHLRSIQFPLLCELQCKDHLAYGKSNVPIKRTYVKYNPTLNKQVHPCEVVYAFCFTER